MTWKDRARDAFRMRPLFRIAVVNEPTEADHAFVRLKLRELLGLGVPDGPLPLAVDGERFSLLRLGDLRFLCMVGTCPECGDDIYSMPLLDLEAVGAALEGESFGHLGRNCPAWAAWRAGLGESIKKKE